MNVDFSAAILDPAGNPLKDAEGVMTLGRVAAAALLAMTQKDAAVTGDKKAERCALAMKCWDGGSVDLKIEDIAMLKARIGEVSSTLVVGRAWALLDPKAE